MSSFRKMIVLGMMTLTGALASAGPALASPVLTPSTPSLEFGPAEVHPGAIPSQSVTFSNDPSSSSTTVESIALVGPDAAEFSLPADGCTGATVEPAQSCEVEVRFLPKSPGEKSATLELVESFGTVDVPLSGTGITGTLSANPTPLSFPTTLDGQNQTEQVTINNANAGTHIETVEITGPDAASFSVINGNCAENTLAQNNSCNVSVRFEPTSPGKKTAQLILTSDATNSALIIPLSGIGAEGPKLSPSFRQALLGEVLVGSSAVQTFTLTNTGDYPLVIQQAFLISGTPLMFPVVSDTCSGHSLEPTASCAITVHFQPSTPGPKNASIILITNSSAGVTAVGIEGVGVARSAPPVASTASAAPSSFSLAGAPNVRPRLIRLRRHPRAVSVNTGFGAICPTSVRLCQVRTTLTTSLVSRHHSRDAGTQTALLLGSTVLNLHAGQSTAVHARLSPSGIALLARRHKLKVSITVAIATPGAPAVTRSRTLTITARAAMR